MLHVQPHAMCTILLLSLSLTAQAAEYVVATNGNDGAAGSTAAPWRTLGRSVMSMIAGDSLTIRGGRYAESLVIPLHATAAKPITIKAAAGEPPIIDGADPLTGWRQIPGDIWAVTAPADTVLGRGLLLHGEEPMPEAAWPTGTTDPFTAITVPAIAAEGVITIPGLPPGNWNGALAWGVFGWGWGAQAGRITSVSGTTVKISPVAEGPWFTGEGRVRIFGGAAPMAPGTWTISDGQIRVKTSPGVAIESLRWVVRPYGIDLGGAKHVTVSGLRLIGGTIITFDAEDCTISDCQVVWPDRDWLVQPYAQNGGAQLAGTRNRMVRCRVTGGTGNGIAVSGNHHVVDQCHVKNVDAAGTYSAGLLIAGDGHRLTAITIDGCGRDGVHLDHHSPGQRIFDGLDVGRVGLVARDCGAFYAWGQDGMGTVISHSWFHDNHAESAGPLVYFDDNSHNFLLNRIVTWNSKVHDAAVRLNGGVRDITIAHLTSFACAPIGANTYIAEGRAKPIWRTVNVTHLEDPEKKLNDYLHHDFRPASQDTLLRDRGIADPLSGPAIGGVPDLGAYEDGTTPWVPGGKKTP